MAHILIMPRQGNTVESCILVEWKISEGDTVTEETAACSVETDKAAFEVPAGASGTVLKILRAAGDDVPVLEPIAVIGAAGEDWQSAIHKEGEASPSPGKDAGLSPLPPSVSSNSDGVTGISPRARNLAEKEALPVSALNGTGPDGRIIERDVLNALHNKPTLTAAAKAAGPGTLPEAGSGIGGRITVEDRQPSSPIPVPSPPIPDPRSPIPDPYSPLPIKGIRKIIADRMLKSLAETAQFTLNASASVSRLQDIHSRMKKAEEFGLSKITVNDLILFAVSRVLPRFPYMNAHKIDDLVKTFEQVHLGLAVDTPRGLMVPVIRNANLLSLAQISSEAKRLAVACQNGSARPDELTGSTFTVTNLGSLGITSFTPVLNIPEVAILGVCNIELKPVTQPKLEPLTPNPYSPSPQSPRRFYRPPSPYISHEPHIGFSLTINHQVVDGAPAARFLKALSEVVADIDLWLAVQGA